jgi:hypothetical protein
LGSATHISHRDRRDGLRKDTMTIEEKADAADATVSARRDTSTPIAASEGDASETRRRARTARSAHVDTTRQRRCPDCGRVGRHHADCAYEQFTAARCGAVNPGPE